MELNRVMYVLAQSLTCGSFKQWPALCTWDRLYVCANKRACTLPVVYVSVGAGILTMQCKVAIF